MNIWTKNKNAKKTVSSLESIGKSDAVDKAASDFDNASQKFKKIKRLIKTSTYDADIARYIPGSLDLIFHRMTDKITMIENPHTYHTKRKNR